MRPAAEPPGEARTLTGSTCESRRGSDGQRNQLPSVIADLAHAPHSGVWKPSGMAKYASRVSAFASGIGRCGHGESSRKSESGSLIPEDVSKTDAMKMKPWGMEAVTEINEENSLTWEIVSGYMTPSMIRMKTGSCLVDGLDLGGLRRNSKVKTSCIDWTSRTTKHTH